MELDGALVVLSGATPTGSKVHSPSPGNFRDIVQGTHTNLTIPL